MNIIAISNHLYDDIFDENFYKENNFFLINDKTNLTFEKLQELEPDFVFFPHWSYIIPKKIFENFNCVIFHMTDLPFGRGGSPLQNLIARGIYETKISAIKCSEILDGGDVYLKKDFSLAEKSAANLYREAGFIVKEMISEIVTKKIVPVPQVGEPVCFPRRTAQMSDISGLENLDKVFDYIRMLDAPGYPKAFLNTNHLHLEFENVKKDNSNGKLYATVWISEVKK